MPEESRQCQNCKQAFQIDAEDFGFYKKISVPPPTFCPECRMQRRFSWRNERTLHRNKCAKTGKAIISGFAPDSGYVVYDRDAWWSDDWDPLASGAEYDFSKPFFAQFHELMKRTPQPAVFSARTTNCEYSNHVGEIRNGYLVAASWAGENLAYASRCNFSKDCEDCFGVFNCELCYELISSTKCYRTHFSQNCEACADSMFLFDCKGCSNCIGCVNLRNKSYYIFNESYSKEDYLKKLAEMELHTVSGLTAAKEKLEALKLQFPRRYAALVNSQNSTGDSGYGLSNCKACFDITETKDSKYLVNGGRMEGVYDGYGVGIASGLIYEAVDTGDQGERMCFDVVVWSSTNAFYSYNCIGCQNLFGCVGLRNKQNCILNRQYSKEEFEELREKIVAQMNEVPFVDGKGRQYRFGEFFPTELSPFGYNETVAQEYFPLNKLEAEARGFNWREPETRQYAITKKPEELPERIEEVSEEILKEVIGCAHGGSCTHGCTTAFRIVPQELQFYKRLNLPLPRLCPNCRHHARLAQRNPLKLWQRRCMCAGSTHSIHSTDSTSSPPASSGQASSPQAGVRSSKEKGAGSKEEPYRNTTAHFHGDAPCPREFETPYSPDCKEIVYCESCYQAEVA